jgi:TolA-binding protein
LQQARTHLAQSRERERELESRLGGSSNNNDDNTDSQALLANAKQRVAELEAELQQSRSSVDDLILEIEAVATEESKTREQNAKLLQQLSEGQSVRAGMMEENLRLQQLITDKDDQCKRMRHKYGTTKYAYLLVIVIQRIRVCCTELRQWK